MISFLKEKYFENITIKNYINEHKKYNFLIMKHFNVDKTPKCIKQYPHIVSISDIHYEIDDELVNNTNIKYVSVTYEYISTAYKHPHMNIHKIANMQWLVDFHGSKKPILIDNNNMTILRLEHNESTIVVPENIENINMTRGCLSHPISDKIRIIYSHNVKKIRIVTFNSPHLNKIYLISQLFDNLPLLLTNIIFYATDGSYNKDSFNTKIMSEIELELTKIKIPFGCKITFE